MNKKDKIIELLQKIETITQMQFDCKEYLENGCSVYSNIKGEDSEYSNLFYTGSYTDFDKLDKTLEIDLNGCDLEEVILTLFSNGFLNNNDIKLLTGWNFSLI